MAKYMDSENFKHFWNNILKPNLLKKVDKVSGKGLSTNDFTDTYKNAIGSLQDSVGALNTTKVDKVIGKDLSTNDFTNEYKDLIVANKDAISKLKGFIYPCTAQALEEMSQEQQAELHTQGYRAVKTENNGTVVLLGLGSDGSLEWLGCNQPRGNLLDNGNFINPVNQRGVTSALSNSSDYFIDRWMTYQANINNVTYSLVDNGISLTPVEHGNYAGMQQRIETPLSTGEDYTIIFSVDGDNIVLPVTGGTDKIGEETNNIYLSYLTNYGGYNAVRVIFTTNRPFVVNNARLIKGSYTPKTLPPWEDIDSVVNLIRCRDYYRALSAYGFVGIAVADTTNSVQGVIFGEQMRIFNPSILGGFVVFTPTSSTNITAFNYVSYQGNGFRFSAQTTGGVAIGMIGFLAPSPNSGAISADI